MYIVVGEDEAGFFLYDSKVYERRAEARKTANKAMSDYRASKSFDAPCRYFVRKLGKRQFEYIKEQA